MTPAVSVVVVTYNGEPFIRRCLESLRAQTFRDLETIVVDNASKDPTCEIVAREFPEVALVRLERNTGFAGGNNEGYRRASGRVVALLNQDTRAPPDWLGRLAKPLLEGSDERLACTHSPILNEGEAYADSTASFDPSGARLSTLTLSGRNCATQAPYDPDRMFYGSGGALAVRKSSAGERLFDDDYFLYGEDVALGWRLRLRGEGIRMVPEAAVHHALPPEGRPLAPELIFLSERNRLFNIYIHYSTRTRWLLHPVFAADLIALGLPKPGRTAPDGSAVAGSSPKGAEKPKDRSERRRAVGRAVLVAIASNPVLRRKHAAVEARRRVPDSAVTAAMTSRVAPFDEGLFGRLNRFSYHWCRAFGIATVETPTESPRRSRRQRKSQTYQEFERARKENAPKNPQGTQDFLGILEASRYSDMERSGRRLRQKRRK